MDLALRSMEGRKKGGGRAPQEAADTLRSTQIAEVVYLLGEGEIKGLVNGLKSVYLDGVPVENADGSRNFDNVDFAYVPGTMAQQVLPGLTSVQNEIAVGLQINQASPVVRTITDPSIDHVRVTIGVPQLSYTDPGTGDIVGSSFEWAVEVQSAGGGYVERYRKKVEGKTTTNYSTSVRIELTGSAPWDVRVRRITADPPTVNTVNRFNWASYTEITTVKLRYPQRAMAMLRVNAQNFGRVPVASFDALWMICKVPSNWNPITRAYTGVWDGTFVDDWTDNPAWVLYDIVTKNRYGLGDFVPATLANKWRLYAIAQYCDQLVPDGRGGMEPRFTCHLSLETREDAFKVLQDVAAIFRGMVFWATGAVDFEQDAPADAVHTFSPANVFEGRFTYSDTSEKTKHSVFICWWNDLGQLGKGVPEVYVDETLVARYGVRELELRPLGLTSRGQAARVCRWARHSEQDESELVTFETGTEGHNVRPGRVFKVADPSEQGERLGGRIRSASAAVVTLDAQVTLAAGETYELTVLQPDPADAMKLLTEKRTVTTPAGTTNVITVATPFSAAPQAQTVWLLESSGIGATWWRCLHIGEVKGANRIRITAVAHNPYKYDKIEQGLVLDPRPISRLSAVPARPASVSLTETPYLAGTEYRSRVTISWPEPAKGLSYTVSWRLNSSTWTDMPPTSANSVEIDGLARGLLEVQVKGVNALGNASLARENSLMLVGKTARPSDVAAFTAVLVQGGVKLEWAAAPDPDYLGTEVRIGASWAAGTRLWEGAANKWTWPWPAIGTYQLWAKHYDTSGNESLTEAPASVSVTSAVYVQWGDVTGTGKPPDALNWDFVQGTEGWNGLANVSGDSGASGGYVGVVVGPDATVFSTRRIGIDPTRVYRVRARVKRISGAGALLLYVGLVGYDSSGALIYNPLGSSQPYPAAAAFNLSVGDWRVFEGIISGTESPFPSAGAGWSKFWPGTVTAAPLVLALGAWTGTLLIDYADIVDITTDWAGMIGGAGRPADSATRDLVLVATGDVSITGGNRAQKANPAATSWNTGQAYSLNSHTGGAFVSGMPITGVSMLGLNTDPTIDADYASIDYALYFSASPAGGGRFYLRAYESGVDRGVIGTYAENGSIAAVKYDGYKVRYELDGAVVRTVNAPAGLKLFADSSFYSQGAVVEGIRFGPMSGVDSIETDQVLPGAISTSVRADIATNLMIGVPPPSTGFSGQVVIGPSLPVRGLAGSALNAEFAGTIDFMLNSSADTRVEILVAIQARSLTTFAANNIAVMRIPAVSYQNSFVVNRIPISLANALPGLPADNYRIQLDVSAFVYDPNGSTLARLSSCNLAGALVAKEVKV